MAKIRIKSLYIVISVIFLIIFLPGYARLMELRARNLSLEKEIKRLERENLTLYKEKERMEKDMGYVEKVARESMGVTKKGEIQIKIER